MKNISKHITYKEATNSYTAKREGIDNTPNEEQLKNMRYVAVHIFEVVRKALGGIPIYIPSFFRSLLLNDRMGGATNSQHTKGEAMDMDADKYGGITNKEIFEYIRDNLDFDQLIGEFYDPDAKGGVGDFRWIHVSCKCKKEDNRKQTLVAYKDNKGKTKYRKI